MKKFWKAVLAMKTAVCCCYCAAVCVYMAVGFCLGWESLSIAMLFSLLLVCAAAGILQVLAFTELIIKGLAYGWRMVLFAVPFFAVLTAAALGFHWFPPEVGGAWITFAAIALAIFVAVSAGFELYFRLSGKKYDGLLGQYRKNREQSSQ